MDTVIDLIKVLGPALIVLYAVFLMMRSFLNNRLEESRLDLQQKSREITLPIRLQAYERITLLLERITPANVVSRLNKPDLTSSDLMHILIKEIREEYSHNLSQQLYMSDEAWTYVSGAVEDTITIINEAARTVEPESKSVELAKVIFEKSINNNSLVNALAYIKNEIRGVF
ncbi:MAG: hypothetical protein JXQ90_17075 [Cyclobacteriaceae bacterium]